MIVCLCTRVGVCIFVAPFFTPYLPESTSLFSTRPKIILHIQGTLRIYQLPSSFLFPVIIRGFKIYSFFLKRIP